MHSALLYNLRTVPFTRHAAVTSLWQLKEEEEEKGEPMEPSLEQGVSLEELINAMQNVGNNWEREPLRHSENRAGWEESLVGCLKDVSFHHLFLPFSVPHAAC